MIFTCATDDFQKSRENAIFENCIKNLSFEKKKKMFDVFKMARQVCRRLHFNLIKYFTKKSFIFKNVLFFFFEFLTKKRRSTRKLFQNTTKLLSMKMHKLRQRIISISSAHTQKNEIENIRL